MALIALAKDRCHITDRRRRRRRPGVAGRHHHHRGATPAAEILGAAATLQVTSVLLDRQLRGDGVAHRRLPGASRRCLKSALTASGPAQVKGRQASRAAIPSTVHPLTILVFIRKIPF